MEARTIADAVHRRAETAPEWPAIVGTQFRPLSYGQLSLAISRLRSDLGQAGFDATARIVVVMPSGALAATAIVSIASCAIAVPLDTKLALPEVERRLKRLRPAAVALLSDIDLLARDVAKRLDIPTMEFRAGSNGALDLRPSIPCIGSASVAEEPGENAIAFVLQSSGTTGEPKLIPYSHRNMLATAGRVQGWFELTPTDRCLSVSPVHYCHGLTLTVLVPLITGGSAAFPLDPSRLEFAEWFGALAPTWYSAAPTLHRYVLDKAKALSGGTAHGLRFIVSGGAPLPREISTGLQQALGVPVLEHYGASEAAQISANLPSPGPARPGTCGIPPKGSLMIAREDGSRAASRERGEVRVRGPTVMAGYLDAPEMNLAAFVDGWFRTGDMGSLDEDGFLTLYGREKELINRGGEKIAPPEIDEALMRHPDVLEAAAYAMQHPRLGEDVAAAVVLRPGAAISAEELRVFLATQLARFKIPRRIVFQRELPKGLTGKVQRRNLEASS